MLMWSGVEFKMKCVQNLLNILCRDVPRITETAHTGVPLDTVYSILKYLSNHLFKQGNKTSPENKSYKLTFWGNKSTTTFIWASFKISVDCPLHAKRLIG